MDPRNPDDLLAALDPEQRAVVLAARGPVCVLAGAGTGKTRAITHRIAYAVATGVVDPAHVLALTFTARAAGEMRGRLRALAGGASAGGASGNGASGNGASGNGASGSGASGSGASGSGEPAGAAGLVRASTFHAAALRQLVHFWPRVIGGRPPQLIESKLPLLREVARQARIRADGPGLADAAGEIEWAKVCQLLPDAYAGAAMAAGRSPSLGAETVAGLFGAYEAARRERQLIDFESVLELTAALLFTEPVVAREVRDAYRYFVVDEYQDVNPLQKLLLDAWVGDRSDLCVVGDPRQTIFSFTGATAGYLRSFRAEFPEATVVHLVRDYRSTPQVVAVANRLAPELELLAQRAAGPEPSVEAYPDEAAEAAGVAARIRTLLALGVPPNEIAILVRINAQMERFEHALAEAGVPFAVRGGERFYERPEVRKALVLLRGAARAESAGTQAAPGSPDLRTAVRDVLSSAGLTAAPPAGRGAARDRWESLAAIVALAEDVHAARPDATLGDFAAELAARAEAGHAPAARAVMLATMHAAKGLEWDAVLLPGLVEGIIPIVHARTAQAVEEERRLLYVAVTRAREHLLLSWAHVRAAGQPGAGGSARPRQRSRFLAALAPRASAAARSAAVPSSGVASCGVASSSVVSEASS